MKKIKAFTLLEMMIALILFGLLSMVCAYCFSILSSQFSAFRKNNDKVSEFILLHTLLNKDLQNAIPLVLPDSSLQFNFPDSNNCIYQFKNDYVLRSKDQQTDTFFVQTSGFSLNVLNDNNSDFMQSHLQLTVNAMLDKRDETIILNKRESATELMKREELLISGK